MKNNNKNIKPGDYWIVKYTKSTKERNYTGPVLVKEIHKSQDDPNLNYSCILPKDINEPYINYFSGTLFYEQDFVKKCNEKDYLDSAIKYNLKETRGFVKRLNKMGVKVNLEYLELFNKA